MDLRTRTALFCAALAFERKTRHRRLQEGKHLGTAVHDVPVCLFTLAEHGAVELLRKGHELRPIPFLERALLEERNQARCVRGHVDLFEDILVGLQLRLGANMRRQEAGAEHGDPANSKHGGTPW